MGRRDHAMIATFLLIGLRCSEMAGLRLEDLDLTTGTLKVIGKGNMKDEASSSRGSRGSSRTTCGPSGRRWPSSGRGGICAARVEAMASAGQGRRGWPRSRQRAPGVVLHRNHDKLVAKARLAERLAGLTVQQSTRTCFSGRTGGSRFTAKDGRPLVSRAVYRIVRDRLSTLLGRPIHPHVLRHSFALATPGERSRPATDSRIARPLGLDTVTVYAHISTTKQRDDVARYLEGTDGPTR